MNQVNRFLAEILGIPNADIHLESEETVQWASIPKHTQPHIFFLRCTLQDLCSKGLSLPVPHLLIQILPCLFPLSPNRTPGLLRQIPKLIFLLPNSPSTLTKVSFHSLAKKLPVQCSQLPGWPTLTLRALLRRLLPSHSA